MQDYLKNYIRGWSNYNTPDKHPVEILHYGISVARTNISNLFGMGFHASILSGEQFTFNTTPPTTFDEVSAKLARHMMTIHHLVVIGYRYWRPPEERDWQNPEDFDFQINITEDFDSPTFALEHKSLPPLSMYHAIYKGFLEHGTEMDTCFKLLAHPEIQQRVYFMSERLSCRLVLFGDKPLDSARIFILTAQTSIAYINAKRNT